jgi:hypothetical protein
MKSFLLIAAMLFSMNLNAQCDDDADTAALQFDEDQYMDYNKFQPFQFLEHANFGLGISALTMPFLHQQAYGLGLDFQAFYTNSFAVGVSISMAGRKVDPKFGYNIGESKLFYIDLSLYNEAKLLQWRRFSLATRLNMGYAAFHLSDNSIKEKYTWYDENGIPYEGERALPIAANKFFKLAPALHLRYQIAYQVVIEASAAYNWYIGDTQFGHNADFNNYMLQLGLKWGIN